MEQANSAPHEAQHRASIRAQYVRGMESYLSQVDMDVSNARESARKLIAFCDRTQETNGVLRRKLKDLRRSYTHLQKAHTLLKHWTDKRKRPPVVCLIGSTKFRTEYEQETLRLSLEGFIVLSVGCFRSIPGQGTIDLDSQQKFALDALHLRKIDLADRVHLINPDGYVGESAMKELEHATRIGKRITSMEGIVGVQDQAQGEGIPVATPIPPAIPRRDPAPVGSVGMGSSAGEGAAPGLISPPRRPRPPGPPNPPRPPGDRPVG